MAQNDPSRKSLPATPQQRRRFREQGRVPRSPIIAPAASLAALPLVALLLFGSAGAAERLVMAGLTLEPAIGSPVNLVPFLMPMVAAPALVLLALIVWQGFSVIWPLRLTALNPLTGLKNIFSRQTLTQLALMVAALVLLLALAIVGVPAVLPEATLNLTMGINLGVGGEILPTLLVTAGALGLLMVVVAGMSARARYERDLKMTPEEFKEDMKAGEGDPLVRRRWMQIRQSFYQTRMREAVARADVVVANPTHFAVALAYEPWQSDAPVVVLKGRGHRALRIRSLAEEIDVPVVEAPPLARDLYQSVREGDAIPGRLYRAVAEILAYLYRAHGYRPRREPRR
jgi:flagellar biosynthetic protein FlhB